MRCISLTLLPLTTLSLSTTPAPTTFRSLFRYLTTAVSPASNTPFHLPSAENSPLKKYFTTDHLKEAVAVDFLDAGYGSTNNRAGWKMRPVSLPRGTSFEDAKMLYSEVDLALDKGTVIFNSACAHIPALAGAALVGCEETGVSVAGNVYVTRGGKKTSAPPHTDKQDVLILQCQGRKHWRIYSKPDPSLSPNSDPFARGKSDDNLPLHRVEEFGCKKVMDIDLEEGGVLYIPAGWPHTTDTTSFNNGDDENKNDGEKDSIHITFGVDTHIWDLNYFEIRRAAYASEGIGGFGLTIEGVNVIANEDIRETLWHNFSGESEKKENFSKIADELMGIDKYIAEEGMHTIAGDSPSLLFPSRETYLRTIDLFHKHSQRILQIHKEMYQEAIDEGISRTEDKRGVEEKRAKLSCFRVPKFFEQLDSAQNDHNANFYPKDSTSSESSETQKFTDETKLTKKELKRLRKKRDK